MLNRYRQLAITLGVIIGIALAVTQAIKPTIDGIFAAQASIADMEGRLATLSIKEEILKKDSQEKLVSQANLLEDALPSVIDLSVIVSTVQKVASDTEITLGEFSISSTTQVVSIIPIQQAEKVSSFQFKVTLGGSFENIKRFVERLGFVSPMLRMEGLEFSGETSKAVLNFYFQPQLAATQDVDSPLAALSDSHKKAIDEVGKLEPPVLEVVVATPGATLEGENPFR